MAFLRINVSISKEFDTIVTIYASETVSTRHKSFINIYMRKKKFE